MLGVNLAAAPNVVPSPIGAYTALVGAAPRIIMWYQDWNPDWSTALIDQRMVNAVTSRGAIPMITWQPQIGAGGVNQPAYALRNIATGAFDSFIWRSAREAAAYGKPFYLRFAPEMNGHWASWGAGVDGNTPADFVAAWRHVVGIFRAAGANNAIWVWAPNVNTAGKYPFPAYFPGNSWVDWVGLDGYNWGVSSDSRWLTLGQVFASSYATITRLSDRPLMISETGSATKGGDKGSWITQGFLNEIPTLLPRVRAVIWFDRDKEKDWRVNSSPAALRAWRQVVASPLYGKSVAALSRRRDGRHVRFRT